MLGGRMRWYNPELGDYEWREVPHTDEEALSLLDGRPGCEPYATVYSEWRGLGAPIAAALMRAGEAAVIEARRRARIDGESER